MATKIPNNKLTNPRKGKVIRRKPFSEGGAGGAVGQIFVVDGSGSIDGIEEGISGGGGYKSVLGASCLERAASCELTG